MYQSLQEKTEAKPVGEEFWNVSDFARRYRLAKSEENRLLTCLERRHRLATCC
jgi:hypothetical protein